MKLDFIEHAKFQRIGSDYEKEASNQYESFSLHGDELSAIAEDSAIKKEEAGAGFISQRESQAQAVDRVVSSLSNEGNESEIKLNLAKAYIELGHYQSAELILDELANDLGGDFSEEIARLHSQIVR